MARAPESFRAPAPHPCFGAPHGSLGEVARGAADVAVVGVPYDGAAPGREGSSGGPAALREASVASFAYRCDPETGEPMGALDLDRGGWRVLRGARFVDLGDVRIPDEASPDEAAGLVADVVRRISALGALPVVLGGDHSVGLGVAAGLDGRAGEAGLGILHLDAHLDAAPSPAADLTHATWVTHARRLPHVRHLLELGARGWHPVPADLGDADGAAALRALGADRVVGGLALERWSRRGGAVPWGTLPAGLTAWQVSLDVDVLDPGMAPDTGVPVPLGPSATAVRDALESLVPGLPLGAIDLSEVRPSPGRATAAVAAALLVDVLALWWAGGD